MFENKCMRAASLMGSVLADRDDVVVWGPQNLCARAFLHAAFVSTVETRASIIVVVSSVHAVGELNSLIRAFRETNPDMPVDVRPVLLWQRMPKLQSCRRVVYWVNPEDFRDGAWRLWTQRAVHIHIPVAYIWTHSSYSPCLMDRFRAVSPRVTSLELGPHAPVSPDVLYYAVCDSAELRLSPEYWNGVRRASAIVLCRCEETRRSYAQASHRAHIPVLYGDRQNETGHGRRGHVEHIVAPAMTSQFQWPCEEIRRIVYVDSPVMPVSVLDSSKTRASAVATSVFSLLMLAVSPSEYVSDGDEFVDVWAAYSRLFHRFPARPGEFFVDTSPSVVRDVVGHWLEHGIVRVVSSELSGEGAEDIHEKFFELTSRGRSLFPGTSDPGELAAALMGAHASPCFTPNREILGEIESRFLRGTSIFGFGTGLYRRVYLDIPGHAAVLSPATELSDSPWLDALPVALSWQASRDIARLLSDAAFEPAMTLDGTAGEVLDGLRARFDWPLEEIGVEVMSDGAQIWTFAGARFNRLFVTVLKLSAPHLAVAMGNLSILLRVAPSARLGEAGMEALLREILDVDAVHGMWEDPCRREALFCAWVADHPYAWLHSLVPHSRIWTAFEREWALFVQKVWPSAERRVVMKRTRSFVHIDRDWYKEAWPIWPSSSKSKTVGAGAIIIDTNKSSSVDGTASLSGKNVIMSNTSVREKSELSILSSARIHSLNHGTRPCPGVMHTRTPWAVIDTPSLFGRVMDELLAQEIVSLDVETTLYDQRICLIQMGCRQMTYLIDPLCVDFSPLAQVLEHPDIAILIHNASFEKRAFQKHGIDIYHVIDTLQVSRRIHGCKAEGGHSLKAVCHREFGLDMDKTCQTSDWSRRPLSDAQLEYGALDAEILIRLYDTFKPHIR